MKIQPTVFLTCAVHNDLEHTKTMLGCVSRQLYPLIRTIVIDDGSTDGTAEYIRQTYPEVVVLKGDGQLWWTGATHWGIKEVKVRAKVGDFVLTMNNDCTFDKDFVSTLVPISEESNRAIVAPLVVDIDDPDRIWDGGIRVDWRAGRFLAQGPERVSQLPTKQLLSEVDTCTGRGVLIPVEVFETIGNYNKQKLPHYLADYEFGLRAKRQGFKILLTYQVMITSSIKRTGLGDRIGDRLSYRELWQLLFSRRSRVNIIDHWHLIRLACPPEYKLRNVGFLLLKIGYLCSHVFPFIFFRPIAMTIKQRLVKPNTSFPLNNGQSGIDSTSRNIK